MKFILVDKTIKKNKLFIDSLNSDCVYFNYDRNTTTQNINDFLTLKNINNIDRICIVFETYGKKPVKFINNTPLFTENDLKNETKSINFQFITNLISSLNPTNVDFLACELLKFSNYKSYFNLLINNTNLKIGASENKTGNIKYGGDWTLESTKEDIQNIYFNENIKNYTNLFGLFQSYLKNFSPSSLDKDINGNYIDENGEIFEKRDVAGRYKA